eukprot:1196197-Prorocentrum_minimum.AAC.2
MVAFVATQTDALVRSELADNLGLDDGASAEECARARNDYTKRRLFVDFQQLVREYLRRLPAGAPPGLVLQRTTWPPQGPRTDSSSLDSSRTAPKASAQKAATKAATESATFP